VYRQINVVKFLGSLPEHLIQKTPKFPVPPHKNIIYFLYIEEGINAV
jgi:hypothetical protein